MSDDRRAVLESIAFGYDPRLTPGERLKALEQLADLDAVDRVQRGSVTDPLTPEQIEAELEAFAMPAALTIAHGPEAVEPPPGAFDVDEVVRLQAQLIRRLEATVAELEQALAARMADRGLPPGSPGELTS